MRTKDLWPVTYTGYHWISKVQPFSRHSKELRLRLNCNQRATCCHQHMAIRVAHLQRMSSLGGTATSLCELHHGVATKCVASKIPPRSPQFFGSFYIYVSIYPSIQPTNQPSYSILSYPILSIQVNKYHFDQHVFDIFWGDSLGPACRDAPRVKDISAISSLQRWQAPTWRCWGSMIMNWGISYYIQWYVKLNYIWYIYIYTIIYTYIHITVSRLIVNGRVWSIITNYVDQNGDLPRDIVACYRNMLKSKSWPRPAETSAGLPTTAACFLLANTVHPFFWSFVTQVMACKLAIAQTHLHLPLHFTSPFEASVLGTDVFQGQGNLHSHCSQCSHCSHVRCPTFWSEVGQSTWQCNG